MGFSLTNSLWRESRRVWWAMGLLALIAFLLRLLLFLDNPFVNGWDGYFYLVQLKSQIDEGAMHAPDSSPVYLLLRGLYFLTGDPVLAFKLMSALLAGVFTFAAGHLARKVSGRDVAGLFVAAWLCASPGLSFFAAQFPKNLLGMSLLMAFGSALFTRPGAEAASLSKFGLRLITFVLAFLSHRMTGALAMLLLAFRSLTWKRLFWAIGATAAGLLLGFILPGLLHLSDFERLGSAFSPEPGLAPMRFTAALSEGAVPWIWHVEMWAGLSLFLWEGISLWLTRREAGSEFRFRLGWWLLCALLILPFWEMEYGEMGFRLYLAFLLMAPLLVAPRLRFAPGLNAALGALLLLIAALIWRDAGYRPQQHDPPYARYARVSKAAGKVLPVEAELLIAHKGLAEYFTFTEGTDALPWQPEYAIDSTRTWRIVANLDAMELHFFETPEERARTQRLLLTYHLLREDDWQRVLSRMREEGDQGLLDQILTWENPHETRPDFLLRGRNNMPKP